MKRLIYKAITLATVLCLAATCALGAAKESSLLLKFGDNDRNSYWPFSSKAGAVPSSISAPEQAQIAGKIHTLPIKESNLYVKVFGHSDLKSGSLLFDHLHDRKDGQRD